MMRLPIFMFCLLVASFAAGQPIIKEVQELKGDKPEKVGETFDSKNNLRVLWDIDALKARLAQESNQAKVSEELAVAAGMVKLAEASRKKIDDFRTAVSTGRVETLQVGTFAAEMLRPTVGLPPAIRSRIGRAFNAGVQSSRNSGRRALADGIESLYAEVAVIGDESRRSALAKLDASRVNFWVSSTVSRDFDPTRRRGVGFLSPLTTEDQEAMAAIEKYAKEFGDTPSQLFRSLVKKAESAGKTEFAEAKAIAEGAFSRSKERWEKLYAKYKDGSQPIKEALTELEAAVNALQANAEGVISQLTGLIGTDVKDPLNRPAAFDSLNMLQSLLDQANGLLGSADGLMAAGLKVEVAFEKLARIVNAEGEQVIKDFREFVTKLESDLNSAIADISSVGKSMVSTLFSELGLGEDMREIATFNSKGDLEKGFDDLTFLGDNGKRLGFAAGDRVTVGIKISKEPSPPVAFVESVDLYAYPSHVTNDRLFPIVFAQRDDLDSSGNRRRGWRFSPTYMDAIKFYRPGASQATNKWFTPGFGIAISALDQNGDDAYELGLGAGITLLDDRLVGGVGFNLQRNRMYAFFGIRLRLGDLGIKG